jgi:hypothetical protein
MVIASSGVHSKREILRGSYAQTAPEVSSYWQSHTSCGSPSRSLKRNSSEYLDRFFVWSLELCDGSLLCWSVPYVAESYSSKVSTHFSLSVSVESCLKTIRSSLIAKYTASFNQKCW